MDQSGTFPATAVGVIMSASRSPMSFRRRGLRGARGAGLVLGVLALAVATGAHAYTTVGPHGAYSTIQSGIDAAIAHGDDAVRVEVKCLIGGCPYVESVFLTTSSSLDVSGGWASDFQSQIGGLDSPVTGNGTGPLFEVLASGSATIGVSRFAFDGSGNTPGSSTAGVLVFASDGSSVSIHDNLIYGNQVKSSVGSSIVGGGLQAQGNGGATIHVSGNTFQLNKVLGTDTRSSTGGGASLRTSGTSHIVFHGNTLIDNLVSNPNGGACNGGGLYAQADTSTLMELSGNLYSGNGQLLCTSGATGDAAHINTNFAYVSVYDETWTNNNVPSNPGVYEVFIQAMSSSTVHVANCLITHGTWGGLFASADATSDLYISNCTIADNPAVGATLYGSTTQMYNTILWNDGASLDLHNNPYVQYVLNGADPLFVDEANGNYRLSPGSPAFNAGSNTPAGGLRTTDLDGLPRPFAGITDIGAYEFRDRIFANGFD